MSHYLSAIDILVYRLKGEFMRSYTVTDLAFRKAQQLNQFYGQVPKMSLEIISGFVLIASVVFILQAPSLAERSGVLITEILALLLLAQKLLPTFNSLYSGIITIYGGNAFVLDLMPFISRGCSAACDTKNTEHITKGGYPLGVDGHLEVLGLNINIGNSPILRDLNFVIAGPGKINLIAGPSGSGKTTLLGFLIGLVPDARYSEVRLINGTSTIILRGAPFSYDDVAYCQQSCYVFPATLRYNICLDDDFVLEKYNKVIRLLELEDLDARFGNQLISEGAYELSGGQRLRIGLARAIYKNRPILVLDEPTAALDEEFGLELVRRLTKGFPSTIIIIVSHQIALRKVASNIIELK
jgi:ABC-type transport system involved in cytochrome bd biosynthesis fused ATPase/permease subunit